MSPKKIVFFVIIIVSAFIINNMVRSIYTLWQKNHLVTDLRLQVEQEKQKNQELKSKLAQVKDKDFIEEQARNRLFMVKPGEKVVVLSEKDLQATLSAKPKPRDTRPNWKKWWAMFF